MDWLSKISITCFVASYLVVLLLEISRIFFDAKVRKFVSVGFTIAGLFAHTAYLVMQGKLELDTTGIWLTSWFGWCLATAWVVAAAYLWMSVRHEKSVFGFFLLPVVLMLIVVGLQYGNEGQFSIRRAKSIWNSVHGASLLLGTAIVALGFVFGVVYLIQANRLKRKLLQSSKFRLPSLEWLQRSSELSLVFSTIALAIGLVSGIAINLVNQAAAKQAGVDAAVQQGTIAWSDPVVWSSGVLFLWLFSVSIFNTFYQPARQGRKVAYLVMASFLFLVLELVVVFRAGHAIDQGTINNDEANPAGLITSPAAASMEADE